MPCTSIEAVTAVGDGEEWRTRVDDAILPERRKNKVEIRALVWTHLDEVVMWLIMPSNSIVSHLKNTRLSHYLINIHYGH